MTLSPCLLLDGTLIPTCRCAALAAEANPDPLYSGSTATTA
ncbi:hypothetical protein [Streptomyces malaysiensis]|nr:hypothetical protein R8789_08590 [Streptomyces malaysiensis]